MNKIEVENLKEFLNKNEIPFNDINIFISAFTHSSYSNESFENPESYERLEFLGDSVLGYSITKFLYEKFKDWDQGIMTFIKSQFVRNDFLNQVYKELKFENLVKLGNTYTNQVVAKSIYEDVVESLIGAISLDSGFEEAVLFINKYFISKIEKIYSEYL